MAVVQDAYVQYLAQDGNGAISAFLDDGSITTLQVSACSMQHTNLPAVCQAHMHGHANARAWVLTGNVASCGHVQASVSGFGTGQLQLQLSNKLGFPSGCEYQVRG